MGRELRYWGIFASICAAVASVTVSPLSASQVRTADADRRLLDAAEISTQLQTLPGWTRRDDRISRTYEFEDFVEAIAFVNCLVRPAEAIGHHPDLSVSYNRVTVSLTTHDVGGLTPLDFDLARTFTDVAETFETDSDRSCS